MTTADDIRRLVAEESNNWLNKDNWAVWLNHDDMGDFRSDPKLIESRSAVDSVDGVEVRYAPNVDEPLILPKRVDLMPSDLAFQDSPPVELVEQLIDPVKEDRPELGIRREVMLRAMVQYEVRNVTYEVDLGKAEPAFSHPQMKQVVRQAVGDEDGWEANVVESEQVWQLTRTFDVGTEVRQIPVMLIQREEDLLHMNVERRMAEDAIELIGGDITQQMKREVEERVEEDVPMMAGEPDPAAPLDYETETREVVVARKRTELGRIYLG